MTLQLVRTVEEIETRPSNSLDTFIEKAFLSKMPSLLPFVRNNETLIALARRLKIEERSPRTLYQYGFAVHRYSDWIGKQPDQFVRECFNPEGEVDAKAMSINVKELARFVEALQDEGLCPGSVNNHAKGVKALYRANGIKLELPYRLSKRVMFKDRAPTCDELQRLIDLADVRGRAIISALALGGFREATLCQLQYRHVQKDLEAGKPVVHIHCESEIVKGHYQDYDCFLGPEAIEYLRLYLDSRRAGSVYRVSEKNEDLRRKPELITANSPLFIDHHSSKVKPLSPGRVHDYIHGLYLKAGLIGSSKAVRYELRVHSIRKFFKTQLLSLGVQESYVDHWMGHVNGVYHDIESKGVEFLRRVYMQANLSIKPRTQLSQREMAMKMLEAMGVKPEELLVKEAQTYPHRSYVSTVDSNRHDLEILTEALRDAVTAKILEKKQSHTSNTRSFSIVEAPEN